MKNRKLISSILVGLLLGAQVSFVGAAYAEETVPPAEPTSISQEVVNEEPATESDTSTEENDASNQAVDNTPLSTTEPSTPETEGTTALSSETPVSQPLVTGPTAPTGPSSQTGVDLAETGPEEPTGTVPDWVFNTQTGQWQESDKSSFTWDKKSGYWLSPLYWYDTRIGWYKVLTPAQISDPNRPTYLITAPKPPQMIVTPFGNMIVGSPEYNMAVAMGVINPVSSPNDPSISNTGPNSTNNALVSNANNGWLDFTNLVNVVNTLQSSAASGAASSNGNTVGGDAVTGAATVLMNVFNLLSAAWSWSNGNLHTFFANFFNHKGDITLNPIASQGGGGGFGTAGGTSAVSNTGAGSTNNAGISNDNNLNVNASNGATINNNIDASARSGSADVNGNSIGGSATSGDALVELNIINMINSFINSGESFFAVLNLFGDFHGNILFPDGFFNGVISGQDGGSQVASATNTGPNSTNNLSTGTTNNTILNNTNNAAFNNDISANAVSGSADVVGNGEAGAAATGKAKTSQSLFNFFNTSLFADNAVLVMVNVAGRWLGKIVGASTLGGNQSALLTSNGQVSATNTGPNSTNSASSATTNNTTANNSVNGVINNNVDLEARSGNATVASNTKGGDAKSGDATIVSNVANFYNSAINVKRWFGVLIINVFGNWFGCAAEKCDTTGQPVSAQAAVALAQIVPPPALLGNAVSNTGTNNVASSITANPVQPESSTEIAPNRIQVASAQLTPQQTGAAQTTKMMSWLMGLAALVLLAAGGLAGLERKLKVRG